MKSPDPEAPKTKKLFYPQIRRLADRFHRFHDLINHELTQIYTNYLLSLLIIPDKTRIDSPG